MMENDTPFGSFEEFQTAVVDMLKDKIKNKIEAEKFNISNRLMRGDSEGDHDDLHTEKSQSNAKND